MRYYLAGRLPVLVALILTLGNKNAPASECKGPPFHKTCLSNFDSGKDISVDTISVCYDLICFGDHFEIPLLIKLIAMRRSKT